MEKIKTPLMALIDELKLERIALLKLMQPAGQYERAIYIAESLLPTEREVMINIYNQGKACVANELPSLSGIRKDSEKWFTQTFKSYE